MKRFPLVVGAAFALAACSSGGTDVGEATVTTDTASTTTIVTTPPPTTTLPTTTPATTRPPDVTSTTSTPSTSSTSTTSTTSVPTTPPARLELPTVAPVAQVDIGAIGPGLVVGAGLTGVNAVVAGGHQNMIDLVDATAVEWSTRYTDDWSTDGVSHEAVEKLTYQTESSLTAPEIIANIEIGIESTEEPESFVAERASGTDETTSQESLSMWSVADPTLPTWEIRVISDSVYPGIMQVEVESTLSGVAGPSPLFGEDSVIQAYGGLDPARVAVETLGWTLSGWQWHHGVNQQDGAALIDGQLHFTVGAGEPADIAASGNLLRPIIGEITYEDIKPDREFFIVPGGNWTLVFDEDDGVVVGTFATS